jgi:hypothetical protein
LTGGRDEGRMSIDKDNNNLNGNIFKMNLTQGGGEGISSFPYSG